MTGEKTQQDRDTSSARRTTSIVIAGVVLVVLGGFGMAGFADVTAAGTAVAADDDNLTDLTDTPTPTSTGDVTDLATETPDPTVTTPTVEPTVATPTVEPTPTVSLDTPVATATVPDTPTATADAPSETVTVETPAETPVDTAVPTPTVVEVTETIGDATDLTTTDADLDDAPDGTTSDVVDIAGETGQTVTDTAGETVQTVSDAAGGAVRTAAGATGETDEPVSTIVGTAGEATGDVRTEVGDATADSGGLSAVDGVAGTVDTSGATVDASVDGVTDAVESTADDVVAVGDTSVSSPTVTTSVSSPTVTVDDSELAGATSNATVGAGGAEASDGSADGDDGGADVQRRDPGNSGAMGGLQDGWAGFAAASDAPLPPDPAGTGLALVGVVASAAAARVSGAVGAAGPGAGATAEGIAAMIRAHLGAGAIARRLRSAAGIAPLVVGSTSIQATAGGSSVGQWLAHAIRSALDRVSRFVPIPGYSRYDDSDPLENEIRRAVYEEVTDSPGVYRTDVAERVDVSLSTVRYHARVLSEEGMIEEAKIRGKRRLFPVNLDGPDAALTAALDDDPTAAVLDAVARLEPASTSEVAEALDRSPSTVSYHLDRLADQGLVTRTREGKAVVATLAPEVRSALTADGEAAAST